MKLSLLILTTLLLPMTLKAEPLVFESGNTQTHLLELYTSEGCSSCPPADRWLSKLKDDPQLWKSFVPVALHVDYWDWIGWPDRFADARFSQRQRQLASQWRRATVYTPAFILSGQEWRSRRFSAVQPSSRAGRLKTELNQGQLNIFYQSDGHRSDQNLEAHIALLGFNQNTDVEAGENRNRQLHHDFVALDYQRQSLQNSRTQQSFTTLASIPLEDYLKEEIGLAVWVSERGNPTPIQAVGGMIK